MLNLVLPKGDKGDKGDTGSAGSQGPAGVPGQDGVDGQDGYSPTVETSKTGKTTTITITDINGTHTATILDGADGQGSGDMLTSVYDTDHNGIVDNSEKAIADKNGDEIDTTYAKINDLSSVATSGDYDDLDNKPTIPSKTSDLNNDSGYIDNTVDNLTNYTKTSNLSAVATSGSYSDLSNKPTIPSKTSDLTNDSNFAVTNADNKFSVGQTIAGETVVDSIRNKNIFGNYKIINGWISGTAMRVNSVNGNRMAFVKCKPNTTYTVSRSVITSTFRVGEYTSIPTMTSSNVDYTLPKTIVEDNNATTITYTTGSTAQYLIVHYGLIEDTNLNESLATIQVEKGNTATSYTPYKSYSNQELANEDVVVGSIRTKNMFDKNSMVYSNRAFLPFDTSSTRIGDYGGVGPYILLIKLVEGKTYTISKRAGGRFRAGFTNTSTPALNTDNVITSRLNNNDTGTLMTFTVPTGSQYFVCNFYSSDQTADVNVGYENMVNSIQIEEGDTATAYSPYQNLTGQKNYSTEEQVIGTWIDGKPLYRKTLYFASNGGGTSEVSYTLSNYGITNVDTIFITHPSFYSNNLNGYRNPFQYYDGNKFSCGVSATTLNVTLGYAPISSSPFVITLEYTKTTD